MVYLFFISPVILASSSPLLAHAPHFRPLTLFQTPRTSPASRPPARPQEKNLSVQVQRVVVATIGEFMSCFKTELFGPAGSGLMAKLFEVRSPPTPPHPNAQTPASPRQCPDQHLCRGV
jgi:hypothetical protein